MKNRDVRLVKIDESDSRTYIRKQDERPKKDRCKGEYNYG